MIEEGLLLPMNVLLQGQKLTLLDWPPESPDNQYHLNK